MKKKTRIVVITCLLLMAILSMSGCGKSEKRTLRIGYPNVYSAASLVIAKEEKMLEKNLPKDVEVSYQEIKTGPDIRDSIISNNIDMGGGVALMTYIMSRDSDIPLALVNNVGATPIYLYSNNKSIKSIEDFSENSKIAITNRATILHTALLSYSLEKTNNATKFDHCLTPIPAADALASLASGSDFDGAVFSFPNKIKADELDDLTMIADMSDMVPKYGNSAVAIVTEDYANKNKDILDGYKKAMNEAVAYISNNSEKAVKILSDDFGVEGKYIEETLKKMPPSSKIMNYDKLAQLLYDAKILQNKPEKFVDLPNYENIEKDS